MDIKDEIEIIYRVKLDTQQIEDAIEEDGLTPQGVIIELKKHGIHHPWAVMDYEVEEVEGIVR